VKAQPQLTPSRLRVGDVLRVGSSGIRARKMRAALSALGIAIGIASLVGVLGLSESSRADLLDQIAALGTNLLEVQASTGFGRGEATLPDTAIPMVGRIGTVQQVSAIVDVAGGVYRNEFVPSGQTGGITILATDGQLMDTLNGSMAQGSFLTGAELQYPAVVLGAVAAQRLGISDLSNHPMVLMAGKLVEVVGILDQFALAPDLDRAVFVGRQAAVDYFGSDDVASTLFLRVDPNWVDDTRAVLPATVNPETPENVSVSRPSDLLEAQAAAENAFAGLFLGLGAVALLVGGIGIANVMVIGVIERRSEIGLRRSIGATKAHIRRQFLTESLLLAAIGGFSGVLLGSLVTAAYATTQGWKIVIPSLATIGGFAAALAIGGIAGIYPAMRAANLPPTEALRTE
jgi:putative ABC transport system permease protein